MDYLCYTLVYRLGKAAKHFLSEEKISRHAYIDCITGWIEIDWMEKWVRPRSPFFSFYSSLEGDCMHAMLFTMGRTSDASIVFQYFFL